MNLPKLLVAALVVTAGACEGIGFDLDSVELETPARDAATVDVSSGDMGDGGRDATVPTDMTMPTDVGGADVASPDMSSPPGPPRCLHRDG